MDRLFLDANVLFSAAYRPDGALRKLWTLAKVELVTSGYAAEEARRNLDQPSQRETLKELLGAVRLVPAHAPDRPLPDKVELPEKDQPILLAAIDARATHLLTGDFRHFGRYFGRSIRGVRIIPPSEYFRLRRSTR